MKSVTLGLLRKQLRRQVRNRNTNQSRKNLKLVSEYCSKWGEEVAVYQDPQLRGYVAESISIRLGVSKSFALDRLNVFYRMASYD